MNLSQFDYHLPSELIAQRPSGQRDACRLLLCDENGEMTDSKFSEITEHFNQNDVLVLNNTKVIPARVFGKTINGGAVECLFLPPFQKGSDYLALAKGKVRKIGKEIEFQNGISATVTKVMDEGMIGIQFKEPLADFQNWLFEMGQMPIPPYIRKGNSDSQDSIDYQTVFAKNSGSVAAPTAGLHFTDELLLELKAKGCEILEVTLDVGIGTFKPIQSEDIDQHQMHSETFHLTKDVAEKLNHAKPTGKRITAVGTTVVRTLESMLNHQGEFTEGSFQTDLFIKPGYEFQCVDRMVTNFHLPKSSLLILLCAFYGIETCKKSYEFAVENKYRFFSYGDAMLVENRK